ncbi:hypothetical protein AB1L88_15730 [Tautonia sp. JC769]|uniref:hypothetical protein n=1 Tax=Tautonia sp. JC769 TaxID=3232135 RepID=UPI003457E8C3
MADEIKTGLGLDPTAFQAGIDQSIAAVRKLRAEMQRGRATEVAQDEQAQSRRRRSQEATHQAEQRNVNKSMSVYDRYRKSIEKVGDVFAGKFAEAMRTVQREEENTLETTEELLGALNTMSNAFQGLNRGAAVLNSINQAFEQAKENAREAAREAGNYFASLRGEAALTGATGPDSGILSGSLLMRLKTGMNAQDASAFAMMFESSLPAGMQKGNITREVADQYAVAVAQMVARQGADPSTRGDLAGMVANFQKIGSAGEGLAALEAIRMGLVEGRGNDKPLTDALLQVAGQFVNDAGTGMVPTLPELAAMVGVASLSAGPGAAGTRIEQLVRMLQGTTAEQMTFLKGMGVESDMNIMERLEVLVPIFEKLDEAASRGIPLDQQLLAVGVPEEAIASRRELISRAGNVYEVLVSAGFSAEGLKALNEMVPMFGTLQQRIEKAQQPVAGDQVAEWNRQFLQSDVGQLLRAEQFREAARQVSGIQEMATEAATVTAEARAIAMGDEKQGQTFLMDYFRPLMRGMAPDPEIGRRIRLEYGAYNMIVDQLSEAGLIDEVLNRSDMFLNDEQLRARTSGLGVALSNMARPLIGERNFLADRFTGRDPREAVAELMRVVQDMEGIDPLEGQFAEAEAVASAIGESNQLSREQIKALERLNLNIDELKRAIDRTYRPDPSPAPPPGGRGR